MVGDCICITSKGRPVKAKTLGQKKYIEAMKENTITLAAGPAGTGKTYLAVAMAVTAFRAKEVNRIVLTRPAVEAGEKLGFLPGDLQQKVDPYLRPLYDALFDMLGAESFQKYQERGSIEVAPLAYMRGRTLDDSFIILDEAQNTTGEQMKMFLTRLGFNSKMVVTGDVTQIDLPTGKKSGLVEAMRILKNIEGIGIASFNEKDVVRHKLVQDIVKAYEKKESGRK
jgi:phosphate starvation-inducible PhoH-like protein